MTFIIGRLRVFAITCAALIAASLVVISPHAGAEPADGGSNGHGQVVGPPVTVTLITGDRITLVPGPSGDPQIVIEADGGSLQDYLVHREAGRIEVIPRDVIELVPWLLDPALFDVAGLAEMGYDDQHSDLVPLIVERAPGVRTLAATPALRPVGQLASIDATAYTLSKQRAPQLGHDLAALAARPGRADRALAASALGGIGRIWLDRQVTAADIPSSRMTPSFLAPRVDTDRNLSDDADLDRYLTQVGAPAAWSRGLDGSGVNIAVLDSGIDTGHPDLVGQVTATRNFTDAPSADDLVGHGTFVASLAAGTGAAADGARQGIAPAAHLLNGKVLGDDGVGRQSWVIAGMEWAAEQGADIVNLSLSATAGPEDDPVVEALEHLTKTTGTLFVVAAGNQGWNGWVPETVSSPGTAASAVTVGAVNSADNVAGFSGAGPTRGSYRAKPDVVAPGVALLGARAGAREDDLYVEDDGTSFATPLVAGAAAIVLQEHPGWTWQQVKSAVMNTADDIDDLPWVSGAGRLAIGTVIDDAVTAAPSTISPGVNRYPSEEPETITVTLTNDGAEPRTYAATDWQVAPDDGTAASAGTLVVTPETVTVAPGTSASVEVTFDPGEVRDGYWHGMVEYTASDGSTLRLPFAAFDEPERYWLDLTVRDRLGQPYAGGVVPIQNTSNGHYYAAFLDEAGKARMRVAPGTYSVIPVITTEEPTGTTLTVAGTPEIDIHSDRELVIDARTASRVRPPLIAGQRTVATEFSMNWNSIAPNGISSGDMIAPPVDEVNAGRVYITPSASATPGRFQAATRWRLTPNGHRSATTPDAYELVFPRDRLAGTPKALNHRAIARLATVNDHYYAPRSGEAVVVGRVSSTPLTFGIVHRREITAPTTETLLATADPQVSWEYDSSWPAEGPQGLRTFDDEQYPAGATIDHHFHRGMHVDAYPGNVYQDQYGVAVAVGMNDGTLIGAIPMERLEAASTTLYRNDQHVQTWPGPFGFFDVPGESAHYRLASDVQMDTGQQTSTEWTFDSAANTDIDLPSAVPPLLTVDYGPSVDLLGTAPSGRALTFDLRLSHLPGSSATERIDSLALDWSTTGGTDWQPTTVRRTGPTSFTATIPGSDLTSGAAVSVHLVANDDDGNSIDQQIDDFIPVR